MSLTPGIYVLTNAKSDTTFDLSGGDNRSVIGYSYHGGDNQKWILIQVSDGQWLIRNVGDGKSLAFEGDARDGAPVVASEDGIAWDIWPDEAGNPDEFRICVHDTRFCVDLSDHGNPTPGTPVTLWWSYPEGRNQVWRFSRIGDE
ncbi:carbohydrate-binding module family 13 protein [Gloeopeniophorella convolvens]|nr:carbohydrate-binding module family 13 protein [Gloeopeniophorella convolvens]